jgi:hypothetical protein
MKESDWMNLQLGDRISSTISPYAQNLIVDEICEDERFLKNWWARGYPNAKRLCKMVRENDSFHTWNVDFSQWKKNK